MLIDKEYLSQLPIQIAERVDLANRDSNERVRIWTGFEIIEATLRWIFAATVSAVYSRDGQLSDTLLRQISSSIQRPTLASWSAMSEALSRALEKDQSNDTFGREFAEFYLLYADHPEFGNVWRQLTDRRNAITHGGGLTSAQARTQWNSLASVLSALVKDLAACHERYAIVAQLSGKVYDLKGLEPTTLKRPPKFQASGDGDGTWLVRTDGTSASLRPLLNYEPIEEIWEIDQFRSKDDALRRPVPQSYFKLAEDKLYYIPIGVDDFVSVGKDTNAFKTLFPDPPRVKGTLLQSGFLRDARIKHLSGFVGRVNELQSLEQWLDRHVPTGNMVGLVVGGPGLGKSALIAKAAMTQLERNTSLNRKDRRVVYHVFSAENPANDRRLFMHNLLQQLQHWMKKSVAKSQSIGDAGSAEQRVRDLLEQALNGDIPRHLTMFIDGLDEIRTMDRDFPKYLVELVRPGLTIVASTRNESYVTDFDAALKVERIAFRDGIEELPGMQDDDVRALLLQSLGVRGREIVSFDSDTEDGSGVRNGYVEKVVEHAAGKPLYVELLVADVLGNNARIDESVRLPASMSDYYGKLLARQGVSDTKAHLAIILCLLSLVEEPLSEAMLADLLVLAPNSIDSKDRAFRWVREALNQGEVFLSSLVMTDGTDAVTIYHQELKGYIRQAAQLRWAYGMASWLLVSAASSIDTLSSSTTQAHFRRFGALYLLDHARAVQPTSLPDDVETFVSTKFLHLPSLRTVLDAWSTDREGFLRTYSRIDNSLRAANEEHHDRRLSDFLLLSLEFARTGLGPNVVHSVLGYDDTSKILYADLLRIVMSDLFLKNLDESREAQVVVADWLANAVGMDRRAGNLERAEQRYAIAQKRLDDADPGRDSRDANRVRSKLEYESGYCAYFRGLEEQAWDKFEVSAETARLAQNPTGQHIAISVQQSTSLQFDRAAGTMDASKLNAYQRILNEQLDTLRKTVVTNQSDRDRLDAERWIMNCKADLCLIAFYKHDPIELRQWYEALVADPWIKKQGEGSRHSILGRIEPRLAAVEGSIESAIKLYRRLLPTLTSDNSPGAEAEGIAEFYWEFAQLLTSNGKTQDAVDVVHSGLATHNTFANEKWKPQLRKTLDRIEQSSTGDSNP